MEELKQSASKQKLAVHLEYGCFPVWFYDENNELIDNDLPEELKSNTQIMTLCTEIQKIYDSLYKENDFELTYHGFESGDERERYAKKLTELKRLLREEAGDKYEVVNEEALKKKEVSNKKNDTIKIEVNLRDKTWRNGLIAAMFMLIVGIFILSVGIYAKSIIGIIIGALSTLMFGFFTFLLANPSQHVSMQMVKGEMSYKELQKAIASEDFERPIHFIWKASKPSLFFVSDNWVVLGDKIGTPVYIPKHKIKSIEVRSETLEISNDKSWDGQEHQTPYYYFRFKCDEKHIFECGYIKATNVERAIYEISKYFPFGETEIVTIEKDEQE